MRIYLKLFVGIFILLLTNISFCNNVKINEFMSLNYCYLRDEDGDNSDWIEIYNLSSNPIQLEGYGLSDNADDPFKWQFPHMEIASEEYIVIFASGKNRSIAGEQLHTNFGISAEGEEIVLTSPLDELIDITPSVALEADVTLARVPDGTGEWYIDTNPSPWHSNGTRPPSPSADAPEFSIESGLYSSSINIDLSSCHENASIYYTLDGAVPNINSQEYSTPILIDTTTVVRAICRVPNFAPSEIISNTYIINNHSRLPIVSIITDPPNLWDWETGIYVEGPNAEPDPPHYGANYHKDWERPASIDIFENEQQIIDKKCNIKIFGGHSRQYPQKSLRVIANPGDYEYQFFENLPLYDFKSLVLRNSGSDWNSSMIRDPYMTSLSEGLDLAYQAYKPSIVYLNGTYWGIHNIREHVGKDFLEAHYNIDPDNIDLIKHWISPYEGTMEVMNNLLTFVENNDLSNPDLYHQVADYMNIEDFIRYQAIEIYIANTDWPNGNTKCWRDRDGGKFRWILYDTDYGYGRRGFYDRNTLAMALDPNGPEWPNPPRATLLFRSLIENEEFKNSFINRMCDLINIFFTEDRQSAILSDIISKVEDEIPYHEERWNAFRCPWEEAINSIIEFGENRPDFMIQHMREIFNLEEEVNITIRNNNEENGRLLINGFTINNDEDFQGIYFSEIPIRIWTEAFEGKRFAGWSGDIESDEDTLVFYPSEGLSIEMNFEENNENYIPIVINEINYNSHDDYDCGDWIELYANGSRVDLSGWKIKDSQQENELTLADNTVLSENEYLILVSDKDKFEEMFPDCLIYQEELDFSLSASGDAVRLYDPNDNLIDEVHYLPSPPWPHQADGNGSTLQLIDPRLDNNNERSWQASTKRMGSPGTLNEIKVDEPIVNSHSPQPEEYGISKTYPNPFNAELTIEYKLPTIGTFEISIYNIQGQLVKSTTCYSHRYNSICKTRINCAELASGVYFVKGYFNNSCYSFKKTVLIK